MIPLISRKNYVRAAKTINYAAGGNDFCVISGKFNQLNFSLRGTATTSGAGADVGKGVLEAMTKLQIQSSKFGLISDINGAEAYYYSRCVHNSAALTNAGAGTPTVANVGYEFSLPITCDSDEVLTITVYWSALVAIGTLFTAYTGVLSIDAETVDNEPEVKVALRHWPGGANGIIGANATYPHAPLPEQGNYLLAGMLVETDTTARGTLTSALANIQVSHRVGAYVIDESAVLLRHIFGMEILGALPAGTYIVWWKPFKHNAQTCINLGNGAVATVDGTQLMLIYVMVRATEKSTPVITYSDFVGNPTNAPMMVAPVMPSQTTPASNQPATQGQQSFQAFQPAQSGAQGMFAVPQR